jgi:hypothetical protein
VKALSIFLLVCFTMVLAPKQWWHHCAHSEHKKAELSHTDTADEDCPVCDLSLSVFTSPSALVFYVYKQAPFVHGTSIYKGQSKQVSTLSQLRAPPITTV